MSLSVFVNLFLAGLLALFVPVLTYKLHHPGLLGLFAGLNALAFILVFLFVPETGGAAVGSNPPQYHAPLIAISLQELNYIFGCRTRDHVLYQYKVVFKGHFVPRYLLFKAVGDPEKFYQWPEQHDRSRRPANTGSLQDNADGKEANGGDQEEANGDIRLRRLNGGAREH